jgi:hypothetical protein
MAFDPASDDKFGMVALSSTNQVTLNLDPRYQYKLIHTGVDASGNADANSILSAWLSTLSATITCNKTVEDEKFELLTATNETIGPGIKTLYLKSTATADGVLKIVRIGVPTNSY